MSQKKGAKGGMPKLKAEPKNVSLLPNPFRSEPAGWIARKARRERQ